MSENRVGKINEYNIFSINLQVILTVLLAVFVVLGFIISKKLFNVAVIFVGLDLFVMAYNNEIVYHNKKVTIAYILVGIVSIIYAILSIIGVI